MLPLATTMAAAGVISDQLAAVFAVPRIAKPARAPSAARHARSVTSDEVFLLLKEEDEKKEERERKRMAKKIKKQEAESKEKRENIKESVAVCCICGMDEKHAVGFTCTDCGLFFHTACHKEVGTAWKREFSCVNCAALQ